MGDPLWLVIALWRVSVHSRSVTCPSSWAAVGAFVQVDHCSWIDGYYAFRFSVWFVHFDGTSVVVVVVLLCCESLVGQVAHSIWVASLVIGFYMLVFVCFIYLFCLLYGLIVLLPILDLRCRFPLSYCSFNMCFVRSLHFGHLVIMWFCVSSSVMHHLHFWSLCWVL